jgi:hypothetical protein
VTKPTTKTDFIFTDVLPVPTGSLVLVVHKPYPATLDVWMPRILTDSLTREQLQEIADVVQDFVSNVPKLVT